MTDILRRQMAPITDGAWKEIELQSRRILRGNLSGRRLVEFCGPHGWQFAAVNLGKLDMGAEDKTNGVGWGLHKVLPLVEIRVPFSLGIWELDDVERGAKNPDLDALTEAARKVAMFEETAIYWGFAGAGIHGMLEGSSHAPVPLSSDRSKFIEAVELALLAIQEAEIGGPYALVLGTEPYRWLMAGDPSAYPLHKRIQALVTGGIYWSPALKGGAVLSRRGGDFEMTVGQDLTIGYKTHTAKDVELYFAESFTFR
ncbi:MAG: family 1 encapsulin nanocompartment shell protein, partial [Holophaga sp.]|nr:family 1 encapsulin nanocompartment shell protein [Holophaga sp.]